jgi:hypothetical protein
VNRGSSHSVAIGLPVIGLSSWIGVATFGSGNGLVTLAIAAVSGGLAFRLMRAARDR